MKNPANGGILPRRKAVLWLLIPVAGLLELVAQIAIDMRVPPMDDWDSAADAIRKEHRQSDLVVIAPWWATHGKMALEDFMPLEDQARADHSTYERLWEVSIRGAQATEAQGLEPEFEDDFGLVRLRRFKLQNSEKVLFSFLHRINDATVSTVNAGGVESPCSFSDARWQWKCTKIRWAWIGPVVIDDLDHRPRQGIWAHPISGRKIRISYENVPAGRKIRGYTGIRYFAARGGKQPPVNLDVFVNGKLKGSFLHNDPDGWKKFEVALDGSRKPLQVTFEVYASGTGNRHFAFVADVRN